RRTALRSLVVPDGRLELPTTSDNYCGGFERAFVVLGGPLIGVSELRTTINLQIVTNLPFSIHF
ncbi:MAG TPA: hypothetical protein PKZ77_01145, partial [Pseudomonadales bacterium]|nr:hypothetical protein [Pseudomonadales bacterium]